MTWLLVALALSGGGSVVLGGAAGPEVTPTLAHVLGVSEVWLRAHADVWAIHNGQTVAVEHRPVPLIPVDEAAEVEA